MIIESKVIAVILFGLGTFFLLCGLMVPLVIRNIDKEDRIIFLYIFLISLVFSYSFIRGGIQLWQI